jgi:hypothetical protein
MLPGSFAKGRAWNAKDAEESARGKNEHGKYPTGNLALTPSQRDSMMDE